MSPDRGRSETVSEAAGRVKGRGKKHYWTGKSSGGAWKGDGKRGGGRGDGHGGARQRAK